MMRRPRTGRFVGPPSQADLERVFFLDDEDRALVGRRRGEHMKLGFALQLVTVRPEFVAWVAARSWTSGDGPKAIFNDGVGWLRERKVLLPGVTILARLVVSVRDETTKRLWGVLEGLLTIGQRYVLDQLLEVQPGSRVSDLERWRKGVVPRASGPTIIKALDQVSEIAGLELAELGAEALVPQRRLGELANEPGGRPRGDLRIFPRNVRAPQGRVVANGHPG